MKKTLVAIVVGLTLASAIKAQRTNPAVFNVPVDSHVDFQADYLDPAIDGDVFNFVPGDSPLFHNDYIIDDDITINSDGFRGIHGEVTVSNALVRFNDVAFNGGLDTSNLIHIIDSSSGIINSCNFTRARNSVVFDSDKDLTIRHSTFNEAQSYGKKSIHLKQSEGKIDISLNFIAYGQNGIVIDSNQKGKGQEGELLILNNTIYYHTTNGIGVMSIVPVTNNLIANNLITHNNIGVNNPTNIESARFINNVLYSNQTNFNPELTKTYDMKEDDEGNFYFDPKYLNQGYDGLLHPGSQAKNKGVYIEDVTTWFPSSNETWIGEAGVHKTPALQCEGIEDNVIRFTASNQVQGIIHMIEKSTNLFEGFVYEGQLNPMGEAYIPIGEEERAYFRIKIE